MRSTIIFTSQTPRLLLLLSNRYISDRQMPDKAIDLIDEARVDSRWKSNLCPSQSIPYKRTINAKIELQALKQRDR